MRVNGPESFCCSHRRRIGDERLEIGLAQCLVLEQQGRTPLKHTPAGGERGTRLLIGGLDQLADGAIDFASRLLAELARLRHGGDREEKSAAPFRR